ncbi:hypothetical protein ALI22I_15875 [Saccharothrix sp. ALI-22-I]|uniref:hypothetical protein n=1 Tax=Saccharothrix sp. ALI-22-I TaxID=1933778 RepID=UPI00097C1ADE|nr:hypothetical protein [Saccharothrix sp. ALI-22-I]ONI89488.1 hypothetical protein ALI22I_15875 [Saccharothrix sp. ALI-22-I]
MTLQVTAQAERRERSACGVGPVGGGSILVHRTRTALLQAYSHDLPFNDIIAQSAPELMRSTTINVNSVVTAFQISRFPSELEAEGIGDIRYTALRRRLMSSVDTSEPRTATCGNSTRTRPGTWWAS